MPKSSEAAILKKAGLTHWEMVHTGYASPKLSSAYKRSDGLVVRIEFEEQIVGGLIGEHPPGFANDPNSRSSLNYNWGGQQSPRIDARWRNVQTDNHPKGYRVQRAGKWVSHKQDLGEDWLVNGLRVVDERYPIGLSVEVEQGSTQRRMGLLWGGE